MKVENDFQEYRLIIYILYFSTTKPDAPEIYCGSSTGDIPTIVILIATTIATMTTSNLYFQLRFSCMDPEILSLGGDPSPTDRKKF